MKNPTRRGGDASPDLTALGDTLEFMRLMWALDHGLQKTSKRMARTIGVTGPQRLVIRIVGHVPGIAAGELARALHVHPSTLTGVLKRLERKGLIRRRPHPKDARRAAFTLTRRGRLKNAAAAGTVESAVRQVLAGLPPDRTREIQDLLRTLAGHLGVHVGPARGATYRSEILGC